MSCCRPGSEAATPAFTLPNARRAGELYLEFTQINPTQPEKPYGFAVQVTNDTNYKGEVVSVSDDNMLLLLLLLHLVVADSLLQRF